MKLTTIAALGLTAMAMTACVEEDMAMNDMPMRTGSSAAEAACRAAVNTNYDAPVATVLSSAFSQAATEVRLTAEGETWRCLASEDGTVEDLSVVG